LLEGAEILGGCVGGSGSAGDDIEAGLGLIEVLQFIDLWTPEYLILDSLR